MPSPLPGDAPALRTRIIAFSRPIAFDTILLNKYQLDGASIGGETVAKAVQIIGKKFKKDVFCQSVVDGGTGFYRHVTKYPDTSRLFERTNSF